jgi:hypothetical protein
VLSPIETGFTNGAYTEIISGIEEGESYYIASVVVDDTSDEASATSETATQDADMPSGMDQNGDMNQQGGGMNMQQGGGQQGGGMNMQPGGMGGGR